MAKYHYLLYADSKKSKLLAASESEEGLKKSSEEFTSGQWFRYEIEGRYLLEETETPIDFTFPKVAKVKRLSHENSHDWSGREIID